MKSEARALIAATPTLSSLAYVLYSATLAQVNHSGLTPHYLDIASVASVLLAIAFRLERKWLWTVILMAAANALLVLWAAEANVIVEYEEWLRRGMPERG